MKCDSCEVANINGVRCHERGCPSAWRDEVRECTECGQDFEPTDRYQTQCGESCRASYLGLACDDCGDEANGSECPSCQAEMFQDCSGRMRCEECDPPCPGCYDGGMEAQR